MDIDEIVRKVTIAVKKQLEESKLSANVLVFRDEYCNTLVINKNDLNCDIDDALEMSYRVNINNYDFFLLNGLSNQALFKIVNISDNDNYTHVISEIILSGKKIYVLKETVSLFNYKSTAPSAYYKNLYKNIEILKNSGIEFVSLDEFYKLVNAKQKIINSNYEKVTLSESNKLNSNKLITLKDVEGLKNTSVQIPKNCIITDLAKDYVKEFNVTLLKI